MLKTDKERIVTELAADLGAAETLIVADYRGLTNKQLEALRDELLKHGARFRIVKNTLTRRAAEQAGAEALLVMLEGPTAIAFIESVGRSGSSCESTRGYGEDDERTDASRRDPRGQAALRRRGRPACNASAARRSSRPARRSDRRPAHAALGARLGAASRSARADRCPDQAARGRRPSGRADGRSGDRAQEQPAPAESRAVGRAVADGRGARG